MNQQLAPWAPEHARHAVNHQQNAGVPELDRVGKKQKRPCRRDAHVHDLRYLDNLAAVESIRERAEINGKQQKRRPVAQHREAGEHRRMEFLVKQPVADDVLNAVRHHRQHGRDKVGAKIFVMQRGESDFLARLSHDA